MAITAQVFTLALTKMATNVLWTTSYASDTIKVMLLDTTGAANMITNRDTYSLYGDISGHEIASGGGYTTGGATLGTKSVGAVIATHKVPFLAAASVWTSASFTAYAAAVYCTTAPGATSPLIASVDFGGAETVASGTFTITWDATNGVFALAAS